MRESFAYSGGSVSVMLVDEANEHLLFANAAKHIYVYELQVRRTACSAACGIHILLLNEVR